MTSIKYASNIQGCTKRIHVYSCYHQKLPNVNFTKGEIEIAKGKLQ